MTITRAQAETILVQRCERLISFVGMAVTYTGNNASLNDPMGYALRQLGYTVTNITNISDTDVANVKDSEIDQFLDYAEMRTLESVAGNMDAVDISNGPEKENFSQVSNTLEKRLKALSDKITATYGMGVTPQTGSLIYNFAAHGDDPELDIHT